MTSELKLMIMKHKLGDKVKIRPLTELMEFDKTRGMLAYAGMYATIIMEAPSFYLIDLDEGKWSWDDRYFEDSDEKIEQFGKFRQEITTTMSGRIWQTPDMLSTIPVSSCFPKSSKKEEHAINLIGEHKFLTLKVKS